ncbi:MAG TPA: hypothetical protein VGZ22_03555 [Isosphaeraceae bacterium]|jgi:hypothetical protein|nr:hypothetical protein [Isosphaeraceae bacterium]
MEPDRPSDRDVIEMPGPTVAPLVLSLGLAMLAGGVAFGVAFLIVGILLIAGAIGLWVRQLIPGEGHIHEPRVEPALRAKLVSGRPATVDHLRPGVPGYRLRLPSQVHPISAGIKGGVFGGVVMTLPALAYGLLSGHGVWYPVNLLAGMAIPGIDRLAVADLEQFRPSLLLVGLVLHVTMSLVLGTIYGVLLPTLPNIPKPLAWAGLLIPLLWTAASYSLMGVVNPALAKGVDWPWFIASQFVYGIVVASVFLAAARLRPIFAGLLGGIVGGLLMPIPAILWGLITERGIWYPVNLLTGMVLRQVGQLPTAELMRFHPEWIAVAISIHVVMSVSFGVLFGAIVPRLRPIPAPLAWGGLVLPMLWTGVSYGLMGVVNPLLQRRVDWPWFIAAQFVFGISAAAVVVRSEMIHIPPAGRGPDRLAEFVAGESGGGS